MKNILKYALAVFCAVSLIACSDDDDDGSISISLDTTIGTLDSSVTVDTTNPDGLALTIYWDEFETYGLGSKITNAIQFSLSSDFASSSEQTVDIDAAFVQFTHSELNTIMTKIGWDGSSSVTVYVRMRTTMSETVYSNVIQIKVSSLNIDMSYITLAGASGGYYSGTNLTLPATGDGEYAGFAHISDTWWNCFFIEGDGTIWGSDESNGPFILDEKSDISEWNVWFPEPAGCYYIDIDTGDAEWSCQNLTDVTLTVGSDAAESMTYYNANTSYWLEFTTTSSNTVLEVAYTATLYNSSLGTSSSTTVTYPLVAASDGTFSVGSTGKSTSITVASAGTYTLTFYMDEQTWTLSEGSTGADDDKWGSDPDYVAATTDYLYIYDKSTYATVGTLTATSSGVYEGTFEMSSWYNFYLGDNENSSAATVIYGSYPSSTIDGALYRLYCGSDKWNLWWDSATAATVYLTVDTKNRCWSYTEVSSSNL